MEQVPAVFACEGNGRARLNTERQVRRTKAIIFSRRFGIVFILEIRNLPPSAILHKSVGNNHLQGIFPYGGRLKNQSAV
jgi:hypothetical protein